MAILNHIELVYRFTRRDQLPRVLRENLEYEKNDAYTRRMGSTPQGKLETESEGTLSLEGIVDQLHAAGFVLVRGRCIEMQRAHGVVGAKTTYSARFTFARITDDKEKAELEKKNATRLAALRDICTSAYWCGKVFRNPAFVGGKPVPGAENLHIALAGRAPRQRPDGSPVLVWETDEEGLRVGDAPLPLKPDTEVQLSFG